MPFYFASLLYIGRVALVLAQPQGCNRCAIKCTICFLALLMVILKLTSDLLFAKDRVRYLRVAQILDRVELILMYATVLVLSIVVYICLVRRLRQELRRGLSKKMTVSIRKDVRNLLILVVCFSFASIMNTPIIFAHDNVVNNGLAYILYSITRFIQVTGVLFAVVSSLRASDEQADEENDSLFIESETSMNNERN